jgi:hypothetical protein
VSCRVGFQQNLGQKSAMMYRSCHHNFLAHQQPQGHNKQESTTFILPYGSNKQHHMIKKEFHWVFCTGLVFSKTWVKQSVMDPSCQHNFLGHQQPQGHNKQGATTSIQPAASDKQHHMDKEEIHWIFGVVQGWFSAKLGSNNQ